MLVISRRLDESIVIHTDDGVIATIKILTFYGNQIKIGFTAAQSVHIDRKEIWLRKEAEKAVK